ncbi:unnamed protein product [Hymenolepis diminuta]|uniref:ISXO2-like transposase domain-containing protein n=1 Tax=Hymenolepis diminuta TaxID=6216 RepID=A0A564YH81_HYMDI|nr:unnamed protein product [Hymenolepis diminuta]
MVDTSTAPGIGYAQVVPSRDSNVLLPIIRRVIRSGSEIHTDEWPAYNALDPADEFIHKKITHKYHFVDPITGIHTQNVESFNNELKAFVKMQKGCIF